MKLSDIKNYIKEGQIIIPKEKYDEYLLLLLPEESKTHYAGYEIIVV